jgi:hypothetical protein
MNPGCLAAALSLTVLLASADAQEKIKASYLGTSGGQTPL